MTDDVDANHFRTQPPREIPGERVHEVSGGETGLPAGSVHWVHWEMYSYMVYFRNGANPHHTGW